MVIIRIIGFVIITVLFIIATPFIAADIYYVMCKFVLEFVMVATSLVLGELTTNFIFNLATTNFGFWMFCLIMIFFFIRWEFKFFGFKIFFKKEKISR